MEIDTADSEEVRRIYGLLEEAKPLRGSTNVFVRVAAERVVAVLLDTLYELDPTLADPWSHLLMPDA